MKIRKLDENGDLEFCCQSEGKLLLGIVGPDGKAILLDDEKPPEYKQRSLDIRTNDGMSVALDYAEILDISTRLHLFGLRS